MTVRDIRFRGRRLDNGEWSTGDLIQLLGKQGAGRKFIVDNRFGACIDSDGSFVNTEAPFVNEVDPETVGQYTGRKTVVDETEICQGDILSFVILNHDGSDQGVKTGYVDWSNDAAAWIVKEKIGAEDALWLYLVLDNDDGVEVIGNIHEHPHLLKGE